MHIILIELTITIFVLLLFLLLVVLLLVLLGALFVFLNDILAFNVGFVLIGRHGCYCGHDATSIPTEGYRFLAVEESYVNITLARCKVVYGQLSIKLSQV